MTTKISPNVEVGPDARVQDNAWVRDNARILSYARVAGDARVFDNATVTGVARVDGDARIRNSATVGGDARVMGYAEIQGCAQVSGSVLVDGARVDGASRIHGCASLGPGTRVTGFGDVARARHVLTVGPVGSAHRAVTIHRHYDGADSDHWGHLVVAGCWAGELDELSERIWGNPWRTEGYAPEDQIRWRDDYRSVIALARPRVQEWAREPLTDADHARWA